MKPRLVLLLTRDAALERVLAQSLEGGGASILLAREISEALQIICARGSELDLAVIEFAECCHGMTLLGAINACCNEFPVIVVTTGDTYHSSSLAYANKVAACLAKPISPADLKIVIEELDHAKLELAST